MKDEHYPPKEFYSPSEITFKPEQVLWLIEHLDIIRKGDWPPEHKETGYVGGKGKSQSKRAPFENPAIICADLMCRLEGTGLDGVMLVLVYSQPDDKLWMEQYLSEALGIDINEIDRRIHQCLNYIKGYNQKKRTYKEFREHKKRREAT